MKFPSLKINCIVEKGANLNLSSAKVPAIRINSIPQLRKEESEVIQHESPCSSDKFNSILQRGANLS